ncbi:MAG: hypothetical protein DBX47_02705 [Clostridiales bacterium]|nr:MAG: hypothetical protein DBX47_02705 [Clostridiales bacterium]
MPKVYCSATTCVHNSSNCCSLSNLDICGKGAKKAFDTECGSFYERRDDVGNTCESACGCADISCEATKCVHNENKNCNASQIDVSGVGANKCSQTECDTYCKK